jgi:hypothetical protein
VSGNIIIKKVIRYEVDGRIYKTEEEAEFAKNISIAKNIVSKTVNETYEEDKILAVLGLLVSMNITSKKRIEDLIDAIESLESETRSKVEYF